MSFPGTRRYAVTVPDPPKWYAIRKRLGTAGLWRYLLSSIEFNDCDVTAFAPRQSARFCNERILRQPAKKRHKRLTRASAGALRER